MNTSIRFRFALLLLLGMFALPVLSRAQNGSLANYLRYLSFTDHETSEYGEIIWFYQADTIRGRLRSNENIGIKNNPVFLDSVIVAGIIEGLGYGPHFAVPPLLNADTLLYPFHADTLRLVAQAERHYFDNFHGDTPLQTRVRGGNDSWTIWQWEAGIPFSDDNVIIISRIRYAPEQVLFFEGDIELSGEGVEGWVTIGCGGTAYLTDDLLYRNRFPDGGGFWGKVGLGKRSGDGGSFHERPLPPGMPIDPKLVLISESDILVANTYANGRGNGAGVAEPDDETRRDIRIDGYMAALGGSFSFQNQNENPNLFPERSDGYWWCDPDGDHPNEPDERGTIYLYGGIAQRRRGYVHRGINNCAGTGYEKNYSYDARFANRRLPGIIPLPPRSLELQGDVVWHDTTVVFNRNTGFLRLTGEGTLTLGPGTTLVVQDPITGDLVCTEDTRLDIRGSRDNPVRYISTNPHWTSPFASAVFASDSCRFLQVQGQEVWLTLPPHVNGVRVDGVHTYLEFDMQALDSATVENCNFGVATAIQCEAPLLLSHTLLRGALHLGLNPEVTVDHCLFVTDGQLNQPYPYDPIDPIPAIAAGLHGGQPDDTLQQVTIRNTGFYGPYARLFSGLYAEPTSSIDYCSWYLAGEGLLFQNIEQGDHNLAATDPLYWNPDQADYHLREGSPLIDAGDPSSPPDPDGSTADIGLYAYDESYEALPEAPSDSPRPSRFILESLAPNPFNGMTTLTLSLPEAGRLQVTVFDLLGREVIRLADTPLTAGVHRLALNLDGHPSGLYLVRARMGNQVAFRKALLVK